MKIAFVGKGGSGKTTLTSLFAKYCAAQGHHVIAYDADINQHLAQAFGLNPSDVPSLGQQQTEIKDYLRGTNSRIPTAAHMYKTTPPGEGSRLLSAADNPLYQKYSVITDGVRLMQAGEIDKEGVGVNCYHGKNGVVELMLGHTVEAPEDIIITDMTAGADAFSSGMFTRVNIVCLVVEPTVKSLSVFDQFIEYGHGHDLTLLVVGNKVEDTTDEDFIRQKVGDKLIASIGRSPFVRRMERGEVPPLAELEGATHQALEQIHRVVTSYQIDWDAYLRQGHAMHRKNAKAWINKDGFDATHQIDESFSLVPARHVR